MADRLLKMAEVTPSEALDSLITRNGYTLQEAGKALLSMRGHAVYGKSIGIPGCEDTAAFVSCMTSELHRRMTLEDKGRL